MVTIILKRGLSAIPLLFVVSIFAFLLLKAIPGDPVDILLGSSQKELAPQQIQLLREEMGLNLPWPKQYLTWLSGWWGKGELGRSYRDGRPVVEVIGERFGKTFLLVSFAVALAFGVGIGSGLLMAVIAAYPLGRVVSPALVAGALFLYSAPSFWLAFLAVYAVQRWAPGWPILGLHAPGQPATLLDSLQHVLLPALLLSSRKSAKIALYVRAMIVDQLTRDYVLVARSKGLSEIQVVTRHVFKNSLLPVITLLGLSLPALFGGSVLIETVFGIPGMGRLAVDATFGRNYPVMLALIVIYGAVVVVSNLLADILYCLVDPRLREDLETRQVGPASARTGAA